MRAIILAGGSGSRLFPLTKSLSKQLLPVYSKPMIYYPLSVVMMANIKEVLIITTPRDINSFKSLIGDGNSLGMKIEYKVQEYPRGLAEAFILGEDFIGPEDVCLILGDNLIFGAGLKDLLIRSVQEVKEESKSIIFGYNVNHPENYGVAELNENNEVLNIIEKPEQPKSNTAVIGLYFYPNSVIQLAKTIKPSKRGELEITSINQHYLDFSKIKLKQLGRGYAWYDMGTPDNLFAASDFIRSVELNSNSLVGCIEEIAFNNKWISKIILENYTRKLGESSYANYLQSLLKYKIDN